MPEIDRNGWRQYFAWSGNPDGPVLVLSHSLGSSGMLWERQLSELGDRFHLLRYDHRGHGRSDCPDGEWTMEDFGRDLQRLLDQLGLERVHFCGVSLGGMVGLWLAQEEPGRLDRLVVANTSAFMENPSLLRERIRHVSESGMESIVEDVLDRWFTSGFHRSDSDAVAAFRRQLRETSVDSYRKTSEAICDLDIREGLSRISTPTLVITGVEDRATPPSWGEAIADSVPGAEVCSLPAAHLSNVEAAEEFNEALLQFFALD